MSGGRSLPDVDVCVVGSFMTDFAVRVARRPAPGETVIGDGLVISLGGKGFNQAVAAARSGAVTRMHGSLGTDDYGAQFLAALKQDRILHDTVVFDQSHGTGMGFPVLDRSGQNAIVAIPRANGRTGGDVQEAVARAASSCRVLLVQLEVPFEITRHAAHIARASGAIVVLNPAPAVQRPEALADLADIVVPNRTEVVGLVGAPDMSPEEAALRLRDATGSAVLVTLDTDGVLVLGRDDDGAEHLPAHPVDSVDSIGAGDSFCGALGARLAHADDLLSAARYANAAGAICVTRDGAARSIPTRQEILDLLAQTEVATATRP